MSLALGIAIVCIVIFAAGCIWLAYGFVLRAGDCIEAERNGEI